MPCIRSLTLRHFRNYAALDLTGLDAPFVVLTGANGAGKTNILEAISYLGPGRGLRSADLSACQMKDVQAQQSPWVVAADIVYGPVSARLGTKFDASSSSRIVQINGEKAKSQALLADYISLHWLTPSQDRLFTDSISDRRRFFDRMVYAFDPSHAGRITRYEKALIERSKLLKGENAADPVWLSALESQMAEASVAIAAARNMLVEKLNAVIGQNAVKDDFPQPLLVLRGYAEQGLIQHSAIYIEGALKDFYLKARTDDAVQGGATRGAHRVDLQAQHTDKNMPAPLCSTGEQKALLIGLVLAFTRLLQSERQRLPVLLFDEVAAHLDAQRRQKLYERLADLGGQVFLTGTDEDLFSSIRHAVRLHVSSGQLEAAA